VRGGTGYAYEYAGDTIERMSMDERMTICNMSIEGGARVGYVNPDETTFAYLSGRPFAPPPESFERAKRWWRSIASDADASYDDDVELRAEALTPVVTWGVNPGQSIAVDGRVPSAASAGPDAQAVTDALAYMQLQGGQPIAGLKVDVAFIGSCTNARLSDLREAARIVKGRRVATHVKALVVPGSAGVSRAAEAEGLAELFREAGFEWRSAGCSMCLGMNPDKLEGNQVCAASSNRNFKGRQGSPTGRTLLMSPAMVAAAAITGEVSDVRKLMP
jgi:3-isopropylmalate/(R)-2-methylmalate dehydratase large subunit